MDSIKQFLDFLSENRIFPGINGNSRIDSWVNVKIDKDLPLRISRYAMALDEYVKKTDLKGKLELLSNPTSRNFNYGAQCQLSIMILLQYLKEIKSNFVPSSSGFLFEDFIAGLVHGKRKDGYGNADFIDSDDRTCQIKFYAGGTGKIRVRHEVCDYYIVALKKDNEAHIWIIDADGDFKISDFIWDKETYLEIDVTLLKKSLIRPYILDFKNIDKIIKSISKKLREFITDMYNEISELNYNIETIISGIDKNQSLIEIKDIDTYHDQANSNINNIKDSLDDVKRGIMKNMKRKKYIT